MDELIYFIREITPFLKNNLTTIIIGGIIIFVAIKFSLDNTK